jgi:hypothetical protein
LAYRVFKCSNALDARASALAGVVQVFELSRDLGDLGDDRLRRCLKGVAEQFGLKSRACERRSEFAQR